MDNPAHYPGAPSAGRLRKGPIAATLALTTLIFVVDLSTRPGVDIGVLYVVPLLIGSVGAPPRFAALTAWLMSVLIVGGVLKDPWAELPWIAFVNRSIALVVIWSTASIVYRFRDASQRLEQRTRDLADMSYALDQSAIVATTDIKGAITFVNEKFCEISKYSREELLGQNHRILNSGYHSIEFFRHLWRTIASGSIWRGEIRNRAKDGSLYWVDTTIVPFLDARGKPYQYMAIRYEITDRKRSEELLREQAALARLGEMAAVVAHEVKNPIAGIRGALQVLASRMPAGQRDRTVMSDVISRLDSLNAIVQDLLQFARPRQLRAEPTEIGGLIANTADLIRRDPAFAAVDVRIEGPQVEIEGDREQLQMAIQNILINAAQAMAGAGAIEVGISTLDSGCRLTIADRGPGMATEVREKAFEPFFTTKHRGTGLGLAIARRVIEGHGGQIRIETPAAGGTTVSIDLPGGR